MRGAATAYGRTGQRPRTIRSSPTGGLDSSSGTVTQRGTQGTGTQTSHRSASSTPTWPTARSRETCLDTGAHLVAALCKYYGLGRPQWLVKRLSAQALQRNELPRPDLRQPERRLHSALSVLVRRDDRRHQHRARRAREARDPAARRAQAFLRPRSRRLVHQAVEECVLQGYMGGYDESRFGPSDALTRGQAVCTIANAARGRSKPTTLSPSRTSRPSPTITRRSAGPWTTAWSQSRRTSARTTPPRAARS